MRRCNGIVLGIFLSFLSSMASAQVATGAYAYGSYDSKGIDTVNVGNLNVI
jgi:hypothetical protein